SCRFVSARLLSLCSSSLLFTDVCPTEIYTLSLHDALPICFEEVYQIDGGIVRYGEKYGDKGLWEGSLYVFDKRMHMEFSEDAKQLGFCKNCGAATNTFHNCENSECREQILLCEDCAADPAVTCGEC